MAEETALATQSTTMAKAKADTMSIAFKIAELANQVTPGGGIPIEQDEWTGMSVDERIEALTMYHDEVGLSMEGLPIEFPKIKMPTGGSLYFNMPDGPPLKTLECIIIGHFPARAWWKSTEVTNSPPDCSALNNRTPDSGKGPTGALVCASCPYNEFGSGKEGRGKACKEVINTFVRMPGGGPIPYQFTIPPTSIRPFSRYVTGLVNGKDPKALVSLVSMLELEPKTGPAATYAILKPAPGRRTSWNEFKENRMIREQFLDQMRRKGIDEEAVKGDPEAVAVEAEVVEPGEKDIPF